MASSSSSVQRSVERELRALHESIREIESTLHPSLSSSSTSSSSLSVPSSSSLPLSTENGKYGQYSLNNSSSLVSLPPPPSSTVLTPYPSYDLTSRHVGIGSPSNVQPTEWISTQQIAQKQVKQGTTRAGREND